MYRILKPNWIVSLIFITTACAPVRTKIENETGSPINLEVKSTAGERLAFGQIPAGTGLDLEQPITLIEQISYEHNGKSCVIQVESFVVTKSRGTNSVHLRPC